MNNPEALKKELRAAAALWRADAVYAFAPRLAEQFTEAADCIDTLEQRLREVEEALREIAEGVPMPEMATATTTRGGSGPASWRRLLTRDQARDRARQALTSDKGA